jgi:hypothetical protein
MEMITLIRALRLCNKKIMFELLNDKAINYICELIFNVQSNWLSLTKSQQNRFKTVVNNDNPDITHLITITDPVTPRKNKNDQKESQEKRPLKFRNSNRRRRTSLQQTGGGGLATLLGETSKHDNS